MWVGIYVLAPGRSCRSVLYRDDNPHTKSCRSVLYRDANPSRVDLCYTDTTLYVGWHLCISHRSTRLCMWVGISVIAKGRHDLVCGLASLYYPQIDTTLYVGWHLCISQRSTRLCMWVDISVLATDRYDFVFGLASLY
jgi:hypothetical protein